MTTDCSNTALKAGDKITSTVFIDRFVYEWMGDKPSFCIWAVASLDGPLPDAIIRRATEHLIWLVPILSARPKFGFWRGSWRYVDPGDVDRLIERQTATTEEQFRELTQSIVTNPIDANDPPLLRITSIDGPSGHKLVFQIHHLILDGEGLKRITDLFALCCRKLEKDPDWVPEQRPNTCRSWAQMIRQLRWWRFLQAPFVLYGKLLIFLVMSIFGRITARIKGDRAGPFCNKEPENPSFETVVLDKALVARVQQAAKKQQATVNDTIMTTELTTTCGWNAARNEPFERLQTVYSANLRRWWGEPEGAFSNMSCVKFLFVKRRHLTNPRLALPIVKSKLDREKSHMGIDDLWSALTVRPLPEFFRIPLAKGFGSAMTKSMMRGHGLTNIGIIPEASGDFGSVKATAYSLLAPVFPAQGVLFTVTGYRREITVHMGFDGISMDRQTASEYLERFKGNYEQLSGIV